MVGKSILKPVYSDLLILNFMTIPNDYFIFMGTITTYTKGIFMAIDVKKLFADAIIELSNEKPLSKVTVTDIVKHVGTGRQTFYNHFLDKNDLIFWIFLRTLRGEKKIIESSGFYTYLLSIYENAKLNQPFLLRHAIWKARTVFWKQYTTRPIITIKTIYPTILENMCLQMNVCMPWLLMHMVLLICM